MRRILFVFVVMLLGGCSEESPTSDHQDSIDCPGNAEPKGDRLLGIDFLDQTEDGSFDADFELLQGLGIEFTGLHLTWDQVEPLPGEHADPGSTLEQLAAFCDSHGIKLSLTIRPIDLTGKTVPMDLEHVRFNTTEMKSRFNSMIDFVLTKIDVRQLTSLQIGNEIDGYAVDAEHPDFWNDYGDFLFSARNHVDSHYPGLKTGFTVTLLGVTSGLHQTSGVFEALAEATHVVGVTYYPLNVDFTVMDPAVVDSHFDQITSRFDGKTIYLQEVGYQSSSTCNSSERMQAQFICNVFHAWDRHRDQIKLLEFVRLNDVSQTQASDMAGPYGIGDQGFIAYLQTLGLRSFGGSGQDKESFPVLREHAKLRGWNGQD